MQNILFNQTIFSQVNHLVVLLYQSDESSTVISLPNAHLLTFINSFDSTPRCQHHITTNNDKTFSLFAYSDNIQTWLWNHNVIPNHLDEIIIFCPPNEKQYFKDWLRRYTHKIKEIVICDELDRETLLFGMKYIKNLYAFFKDDHGVLNLLKEEYRKMGLALIDSFQDEVKNQDNFIRLSQETS
jgi:hypothetical protein